MTSNPATVDHRTWVEIDSSAFNHNIAQISALIGDGTALGVVLKADAYGHGLELMGRLCQENNTISWLFTAGLKEAIRLRQQGITKPILVLAYCDDDLQALAHYRITCAVPDYYTAEKLSQAALKQQQTIDVHVKIDTGMSRFGFQAAGFAESFDAVAALKGLQITGIFTHLSDTNNSDYSFIHEQLKKFESMVAQAETVMNKKLYTHAIPSGALHVPKRYDCVRVGTNAYGYYKSTLQEQRLSALSPAISLRPVLAWKTRIAGLKNIKQGDAVGYHRTFIATAPMKIAILPVGYYDGYPRALSHKGRVYIRQMYAPMIGIISMNSMMIDVTHIGSVRVDDEVVLCGDIPGLNAHDLAIMTDSIQNEFLARISSLIPRVVI